VSGGSPPEADGRKARPAYAPISNKIKWLSTISVLGYLGWLVPHAYDELNEVYDVVGQFRRYRSPFELPEGAGWVIDPRGGDLDTELSRRFLGGRPLPPLAAPTTEAWAQRLNAVGLATTPIDARADFEAEAPAPRLILLPTGPRLVLGRAEGGWVAFEPEIGVVLLAEVSTISAPALRLEIPARAAAEHRP
jgi:hypothetical protein